MSGSRRPGSLRSPAPGSPSRSWARRFSGDLRVTAAAPRGGIDFGLENLAASLSAGGREFARLTGGAGALRIAGGTLVSTAPLTGTLTFTLPTGTLTGTFSLDVDTAPATRKLEFSATAANLEVNGTVVTADVTYRRALVGGVTMQTLVIKNGGVEIKTSPTGATLLALENGAGSLTFGAGGLSGSFGGTVKTGAGISGIALSGTLAVTVDTAAGYLKVVGTGVTLNVDSTLFFTADVAVERSVSTDGVTQLSVAVSGATFTASGVSLTEGAGTLVVTGATYSGSLSGVVAVDVPGVSVTGTLALAVDAAGLRRGHPEAHRHRPGGPGAGPVLLRRPGHHQVRHHADDVHAQQRHVRPRRRSAAGHQRERDGRHHLRGTRHAVGLAARSR